MIIRDVFLSVLLVPLAIASHSENIETGSNNQPAPEEAIIAVEHIESVTTGTATETTARTLAVMAASSGTGGCLVMAEKEGDWEEKAYMKKAYEAECLGRDEYWLP